MTMTQYEAGSSDGGSPGSVSLTNLLARLGAEYPELPAEALHRAVDQATRAAAALGGGHRLTMTLARDRLNMVRERSTAAPRRTGVAAGAQPASAADPGPQPAAAASAETVACPYCGHAVPVSPFAVTHFSSPARLLRATCPSCQRQMTVRPVTWRAWTHHPSGPQPSSDG
jgi:endogenous inhibitor of DNA gyrase (YacG/DUF329 family)